MKVWQQAGLCLTLGCLSVAGGALRAQTKESASAVRPTRFTFSESIRKEIKTTSGFNRTETESVMMGQTRVEAEISLASAEGGEFGPSTPVVIKVGNLEFRTSLDKDPNFRAGDNSAIFRVTADTSATNKNYVVLATVTLKWDKKKLAVKIDAKTPIGFHSIVAEDFLDNVQGDLDGESKVQVQFGSVTAAAVVPFHGKLVHLVREAIDIKGEAITVNLRGELKKP